MHRRVKEARRESGLSQKAFAAKLGVAREVLARWETGVTKRPDVELLASVTGKPIDWFWREQEQYPDFEPPQSESSRPNLHGQGDPLMTALGQMADMMRDLREEQKALRQERIDQQESLRKERAELREERKDLRELMRDFLKKFPDHEALAQKDAEIARLRGELVTADEPGASAVRGGGSLRRPG